MRGAAPQRVHVCDVCAPHLTRACPAPAPHLLLAPAVLSQRGALASPLLALVYVLGMAGCLLFLTRLRRQRGGARSSAACAPCTSIACASFGAPASAGTAGSGRALRMDGSPLSDCGSCSSSTTSSASSGALALDSGLSSPSGPLPATQLPALPSCQIVLMEHQLDTNESVMFVHKCLRPIKTRPDGAPSAPACLCFGPLGRRDPRPATALAPHVATSPRLAEPGDKPYQPLLRTLIANSFTYKSDPQLAQQISGAGGCGGSQAGRDASGFSVIALPV